MATISYEIEIAAPADKIWNILWDKSSYSQWTRFFSEGSQYTSDWKVGGRTLFLDSSGKNGMISTIDSLNEPYEVVFQHIGFLENGEEVFNTREIAEWSGAHEKYFLTEFDGYTKLASELQTTPEYEEPMLEGFEKGFAVVKELAEQA